MVTYAIGDILQAKCEAIVNPVNCVGVMGRGLARQFKVAYKENYQAYVEACDQGLVQPGHLFVYVMQCESNPKYIINFPTKRHWRDDSRLSDVALGLLALVREIRMRSIASIAIPALGAGLGGLPWVDVRACIEDAMAGCEGVRVLVYAPR